MKTLNSNVTIERHNRTSSCSRPEFQNKRKETRLVMSQLNYKQQIKSKRKREMKDINVVFIPLFFTHSAFKIFRVAWCYTSSFDLTMITKYCQLVSALHRTANNEDCEQWLARLVTSSCVARLRRLDERIWYSVQCLLVKPVILILHFLFPL